MRPYQQLGLSIMTPLLSVSMALTSLACVPTTTGLPPGSGTPTTPIGQAPRPQSTPLPRVVRNSVLAQARQDLNQPVSQLQIGRYSRQTWSDGCLGLGGPAESCLAALTPGWEVEVVAGDRTQVYRTDRTGRTIRPETMTSGLPPTVRDRVLAAAAAEFGLPMEQLEIGNYQSETWPDGCLGVPNPVELCLAALTEGWAVEVIANGTTHTYRTDLTAMAIRRAPAPDDLNGLSAAVRDRLLQSAAATLELDVANLQVTQAVAQGWDGCLGIYPTPDTACTRIYLEGWRAVVSDGTQNWIFHLDSTGDRVAFNSFASPTTAAIQFMPKGNAMVMGDETLFQVEMTGGFAGEMRQYVLEADGQVILLRSSPNARYAPQVIQQLSDAEMQTFMDLVGEQGFTNLDGIAYQPAAGSADYFTVTLRSRAGQTQYADSAESTLPPNLQRIIAAWQAIAAE